MLSEAMIALATAGGTAVVQAASTEAWAGFRQRMARWFGRGNPQREQAELERLDETARELEEVENTEAERVRIRFEAAWQARIEVLLDSLDDTAQVRAAEELRALLDQESYQDRVWAGSGGVAVGGKLVIRAEGGSIAAGTIQGGAHVGYPPARDPSQG
ncbi:hypothetical protein [Streptomyces sp. TRM49041]|uniref:hypothetical protein n=1 Tax=Streptomyces sp. TRM49041 TaxID=2603216 RepID=UPI0011EC76E7|nr:hypothetical protein [Streptomyces sp. TRM49041]